jgi:transposase
MKMLPMLPDGRKKVVRDAARAVKRTANLTIERVTTNTLSTLLGLPGMIVTEYAIERQEGREVLHIFCRHEHEFAICPRCGQVSDTLHEQEERCIRHLDIWGKTTYVHFPARRFDCRKCKKPFTESLSWVENKRRQSTAYELHVYEQCKHMDQAAVAEREGLHFETVKGIFQRWARRAEKQRPYGQVRCLGVDELSLRKGHQQFALVLSDLERHCVLAILPERSQKAFETWLETLSEAERQAIRLVAMDMWGPYRGVVKAKLPHAQIVADRFHVMKQLNEALAKIRRRLQSRADPASYELLKGIRWILVRRRTELKPEEEAKLQAALDAFPELRTAYLLKERFAAIADRIQDRSQAERFLRAWVYEAQASGLVQLVKFTQTLQHWWEEFLNYFNEGFTSAVVEGLNNAIRGVIRRAYGYHVFEHFRLHVLVEHGNLPAPLPQI